MKRKIVAIGAVLLVLALLLTLAPACGNGDEEVTPTPKPGITPTPGVTPTPTGEVKTLKMGLLAPLSGPPALWGVGLQQGAEWAVDKMNDRGGLKVGNTTYMVELVSCDNKYLASENAACATYFTFDEGVGFVLMLGPMGPVSPIFHENKVWLASVTGDIPPSPELPYRVDAGTTAEAWTEAGLKQLTQWHPELKTIAIMDPQSVSGERWTKANKDIAPRHGLEVVASEFFPAGTQDFYPMLTKILADDPDVVTTSGSQAGEIALMTKQMRELGYQGWIYHSSYVPVGLFDDIIGPDFAWNIASTGFMIDSPLFSDTVRELYREWQQSSLGEPGGAMPIVFPIGYAALNFFALVIELAQSLDADDILTVVQDPDFTFEATD